MNAFSQKNPFKNGISAGKRNTAGSDPGGDNNNPLINKTGNGDKALKHSRELLSYIIEHVHGGVAVHDCELKYIYVSRRYLEDYNITDKEVIGKHHYEVFPDLPEKWREVHRKALEGEIHSSECDPYISPEGTTEYTRWECRPWYETDGAIGGIIVYTQIITDIVKEREALRESQEIFRHFMENSPVYIFFKDSDIRSIYLSRNYEKMLGMPVENILGKTMDELFPSELAVSMIEDDKRVLNKGELVVVDEELEGRFYTTFKFPIIMEGKPRYLAGYTLDITERVVAEKKLEESNQALTRLIGNLSGIVYRCRFEPEWPMEFISQGCYQVTGYRESDFYNGHIKWGDLIQEEDRLKVWKDISRNVKKNRPFQLEYQINGRYGRKRWVWEKGCGVFDKDGNVIAVEGFITDVTERRETEDALKEVIIQRNRIVEDLIKAKEKAEESDRLKTAFLENVSHEIRTPMNGILGFMNLLGKPDLSDEKREKYIQVVNDSGTRLMATINNIIEISKIESGQVEINYTEVNLKEILEYHLDFFSQQALIKGLSLRLFCDPDIDGSLILTDKHMLNGILTNLLKNAIKFTSEGGIEFGCYPDSGSVVFFVRDTGIGIPPEKTEIIFDRFVQADTNLTRTYEGSGLGLSIVRGYVKALGGRLWVSSEYGSGSTFCFSLPFRRVTHPAQDEISVNGDISREGDLVILIAEDDAVSYKFLETILEGPSTTLLHAENGDDAVKMVREHPDISLVLMDIKMPGMNGLQATAEIRKFNHTIPIIAQTAHAFADDKKNALAAGCNEYISKPIRYNELIEVINRYIKSRHL